MYVLKRLEHGSKYVDYISTESQRPVDQIFGCVVLIVSLSQECPNIKHTTYTIHSRVELSRQKFEEVFLCIFIHQVQVQLRGFVDRSSLIHHRFSVKSGKDIFGVMRVIPVGRVVLTVVS